jgi:hypothetical protein
MIGEKESSEEEETKRRIVLTDAPEIRSGHQMSFVDARRLIYECLVSLVETDNLFGSFEIKLRPNVVPDFSHYEVWDSHSNYRACTIHVCKMTETITEVTTIVGTVENDLSKFLRDTFIEFFRDKWERQVERMQQLEHLKIASATNIQSETRPPDITPPNNANQPEAEESVDMPMSLETPTSDEKPGRKGLWFEQYETYIERLALALDAEEIHKQNPAANRKAIAHAIGWLGDGESDIKQLAYWRKKLQEARPEYLAQAEELRRKRKEKK